MRTSRHTDRAIASMLARVPEINDLRLTIYYGLSSMDYGQFTKRTSRLSLHAIASMLARVPETMDYGLSSMDYGQFTKRTSRLPLYAIASMLARAKLWSFVCGLKRGVYISRGMPSR